MVYALDAPENTKMILSFVLLVGLSCILAETEKGVVYYVSPTEPLSSCPGNNRCPPGQLCHTMDYLAEHSSEFFSSDQVSVILIFTCGVHNYTKELTIQNLYSFVMKGAAESRENVIIDHQFRAQLGKPNCTIIQFFNVSFVSITTLTMRCPAINLKESHITVKSSNLYGYPGIVESLSFINIIGRGSKAFLDNCTFKENCAVTSNFSDGIIVNNSTFQSYSHQLNSIIVAFSSIVTLRGSVNFTDSVTGNNRRYYSSGTAVFLRTTHPELKSFLNITTGATVYFVNLTCDHRGGAVYAENGMICIGAKSKVVFMHNEAGSGAVFLMNGSITFGYKSNVHFTNNLVRFYSGAAIFISNGKLNIDNDASLTFSHNHANIGAVYLQNGGLIANRNAKLNFSNNFAFSTGGALVLDNATAHFYTDAVYFSNNSANQGGAMYIVYGTVYIHSLVTFNANTAKVQGGAIYIESGTPSSITVGESSKLLLLNNSAFQGGALYIIPSSFTIKCGYQSSVKFINNTAFDVGGAVYAEMQSEAPCIFMITDYSAEISFVRNYANRCVGHHMYGTSIRNSRCDKTHVELANEHGKPYCWSQTEKFYEHINISFDPGVNETLSPVSSAPQRVCLCDSYGKPQCANISQIYTNISVYRGETFTLSAHVVGYDFGTTVGVVHARFRYSNTFSQLGQSENNQPVNDGENCTILEYTVSTKYNSEVLQLQTSVLPVTIDVNKKSDDFQKQERVNINNDILDYTSHDNGCLRKELLTTPVFINITLLPGCPPGLILSQCSHDTKYIDSCTTCNCYSVLANNGFKCSIQNKSGFLQWNSTVWVNATFNESHSTGIIYNRYCPLDYCKTDNKIINIGDDPSKQCAYNRIGILCGACMENFSLAIGSSRCTECPNTHNVSLLLGFAAAGVFLVFFILTLNLTVTQGLINGVIFYANVVWAYKIILFPSKAQENHYLTFLQVFIAWLNLDFGIESCFFVGLDAYWKTWLQLLFPFYIWVIAGVIIVACRYSSCLTNLIGSKAVPLLATLFLLSYMKLLRTVIDATSVAVIAQYPQNTFYAVWYLDGNLRYCQHPHIYLFIAVIAILVFLWLPYTLLLLFVQPLRRMSHLRPLKWINKLAPVFDAYFSPLKDKHHYWFGAMLLVRGILLLILTITSAANPELNMFMLLLFEALLFFFMSVKSVYKRMNVRLLESATLLNLTALSAGTLYKWESTIVRTILLEISIGITFAQFCVIVVWSMIKVCLSAGWRSKRSQSYEAINKNVDDDITHERIEDPELEPLINYTPRTIAVAASAKYTAATKVSS